MPVRIKRTVAAALLSTCLGFGSLPVLAQQQGDGDAGAYLAARAAAQANDFRQGAQWFSRALLSDPSNLRLLDGMVVSYLSLGDLEMAAKGAELIQGQGEKSIAANIAIAADAARREDFDALLNAPADRAIGNLVDGLIKAWAQFGKGNMTEALGGFDALAKGDGVKAFALYHKALALAAVGDFEGADEILSGRTDGPIVVNRRGLLAHIEILSQLERNPDGIKLLDQSFPGGGDPEVLQLKQKLEAGETLPFTIVKGASGGIGEVFFSVASALTAEAEPSYTLLYSQVASALSDGNVEAVLQSARLMDELGQRELAAETYARVPADDPNFHMAEIGRAEAIYALGRKDEALGILGTLARTHGDQSAVLMALGDMLRREERFKDAAEAYQKAIDLTPNPEQRHWGLFYSLGVSYERVGDWDNSEKNFRRALELFPDQPQVLNYLGYSLVDRGENLQEALEMIQRAVAIRPDAGYIIDSLAWAYFRLGRFADALEPMERASLLEPVDPVVTDHLGDVYWENGRKLEARFQWRRALSFEPEEKDAIRIRRKLEIGLDEVKKEEGAKAP